MLRILIAVALVADCFTRSAANAAIRLPNIPDSLTTAQERAEYLLHHFMDDIPNDSALFADPEMMQVFVHTASYCRDSVATIEYRSLLRSSFNNPDYYSSLMYHLDYIMGDPASDYRNDQLMETLLEDVIKSALPYEYKIWPKAKLDEVKQNKVGSKCTDIVIATNSGEEAKLSDYSDRRLLLVFASSTCPDCHTVLKALPNNTEFKTFTQRTSLQILVIYIDGQIPKAMAFPKDWIVGIDAQQAVIADGAYTAHHLPSFYIVDCGGIIAAKELSVKQLFAKYISTAAKTSY